MEYRVICRLKCSNCQDSRQVDDPTIEAKDEQSAKEAFEAKYRLCKPCLDSGTKSEVTFDSFIYVDRLPGYWIKSE